MIALLSPKLWLALIFAGLLTALGVGRVQLSNSRAATAGVRVELANMRSDYAQAAQVAEQQAREVEAQREAKKQKVVDEANKQTLSANSAARAADAAAVSLRVRISDLVAAIRSATANTGDSSGGPTADNSAGMLADVLSRADARAGLLASLADERGIAGAACERIADGLQPGAQERSSSQIASMPSPNNADKN